MSSFGSMILDLMGVDNPRAQVLAQMLGGGTTTATPAGGGTGGAAAPAAGGGAGAGVPYPQPATGPTQQAQAQAYLSPPDLVNLYSELTSRQDREQQINNGLGILAGTIVHPENRAAVVDTISQSGGGNGIDAVDPFQLITGIQQQQAAAAENERQLKALPAIAANYGISLEDARALFDSGELDAFLLQQNKPDRTTVTDAAGQIRTIDQAKGQQIGDALGPTKPVERKTRVVEDKRTGKQTLVDDATGEAIHTWDTGVALTNDQQEWSDSVAAGSFTGDFPTWLAARANDRAPKTTINNNLGASSATDLVKALNQPVIDSISSASDAVKTIDTIKEARRAMDAPGGIIAGSAAAPAVLETRKVIASAFGFNDKAATNTNTFQSEMKNIVLPLVKQLGTGNSISNADREFVEKAIAADIGNDQTSMRQVLNIMEKGARNKVLQANEKIQKRIDQETDPTTKAAIAAAWQPTPVPDFSESYLNSINPEDVAMVKAHPDDANLRKQIDDVYGIGMSQYMLGM